MAGRTPYLLYSRGIAARDETRARAGTESPPPAPWLPPPGPSQTLDRATGLGSGDLLLSTAPENAVSSILFITICLTDCFQTICNHVWWISGSVTYIYTYSDIHGIYLARVKVVLNLKLSISLYKLRSLIRFCKKKTSYFKTNVFIVNKKLR